MESELNIQGRTFTFIKSLSNEEFKVQDKNSGISYLLKHSKNPCQPRIKFLKNEIRLLRELNPHPNIITLHLAKDFEGSFYIVYEYCSNGNLQTNRVQDPLKSLYQISLGLKHMHIRDDPIIHRNLHPSCILCQGEICKISGLEFAAEQAKNLTEIDLPFLGANLLNISNQKWAAPEVKDNSQHNLLSPKIDI